MFDIASTELLLIVIIAVIVIGPKDLPRAMYKVGQVLGKVRGMARHFRTGVDAMVREVEMEELEKKWAEQNRRIMEEHADESPGLPATDASPSTPADMAAASQAEQPSHFVAESAPVAPASSATPATDGPPYIAQGGVDPQKGDAP